MKGREKTVHLGGLGALVSIMEDQRGFVFERIRLKFVGHFAEAILDESFLQRRLFCFSPTSLG